MSNQWKFQLIPSTRGILGIGYRMDKIGESVEKEVNEALPYRFRFHKISKIVIWLGPNDDQPEYIERSGVSSKLYPSFNVHEYSQASDEHKELILKGVIKEVFEWYLVSFEDSQFLMKAKEKLRWLH